jgi:ArsR family transcriptional regulator
MGRLRRAKANPASLDDVQLVRVLRALADAKRFRMVQEIAAAGELSCGALGCKFGLAQPTISHHLKILLDSGVLQARHEAQHHFISVNQELLASVVGMLPVRLSVAQRRRPSATARPARR